MKEFAKLFYSEKLETQILIVLDTDDDGSEALKVSFNPGERFGVCQSTLVFTDGDNAEQAFAEIDIDIAEMIVREGIGFATELEKETADERPF